MRSWKASFGHSGICPHELRDLKREGLRAGMRLGCALARNAAAPAVERVAPIFGIGLLNSFQNCKMNSGAGASTGNPNLQRNDAEMTPASNPPKCDGAAVLRADRVTGSEPLFLREHHSSNLSFGWSVCTMYKLILSGCSSKSW